MGTSAGRFWVVDTRRSNEFEASHYALTLHLPAESCKQPEAREAIRAELFEVCSEGAFGVAILTASDPLSTDIKANHGLSPDDTKRVVHEFVMAGFRRGRCRKRRICVSNKGTEVELSV